MSFEHKIISWVQFVERYRLAIIIGFIALTIFSIFYIKDNLGMSTSTSDMLSEELPWRQLDLEYEKQFPQFLDNILVVIESDTPDQANDVAINLYSALKADPKLISDLYFPNLLPYFRQSAFLFLDQDELLDLADQLAAIQPFLGTLLADKNLRGLFTMLSDALQFKEDGEEIDLKPLLLEINRALENEQYNVSWQRLMSTDKENQSIYREFIVLQTLESDEELLPGEHVVAHIRATIDSLGLNNGATVRVRLTGGTVLSYEELKSVSEANIQAIVISFFLVAIILLIGLGSSWLVLASLITLVFGLIATTAFAAVTVGELNLISVAFAVLYIGLGIDFTIHLTLRYREQALISGNNNNALQLAISHIFRSLILCAITTAIGFYSFIPTDYQGVAELGWIAGSGMFISILFTFTLLPALLSLRPYQSVNKNIHSTNNKIFSCLINLPYKYAKQILIFTIILLIGLLTQINRISFDINTLNLQDPENESVQTYRDLIKDSDSSPWSSILLKEGRAETEMAIKKLEQLDLIDKIVWYEDLLPKEQEEKLTIIDEMNLFMGVLSIDETTAPINNSDRLDVINKLKSQLDTYSVPELDNEIKVLNSNLTALLNKHPGNEELMTLERQLLFNLDGRINSLNEALNAEPVELENIPAEVHERWVSHGHYKIEIFPKEDLNDNAAMERFVRQLQAYDNTVIGSPVINIEAGDAVITAFKTAFTYALVAIALLLLILVKQKRDAAIILVSVLVGSVFTFGFMLLFNIPLNFANIIGLPLLLGIGVDSGIHIADRFRQEQGSNKNIFTTSSTRGVIVSSLTTICSIGNLAFSSHTGTASMGLLLTVGLASMMISTMMILPAFLIWQNSLTGKMNYNSRG
ncbi:MAG: MMPL family transporter [Proteobacteria bacterium]|nr:MMPL family transporter [Pseudomonadota bacterium]